MNLNCVKNISKDYVKTFYFAFENESITFIFNRRK